MQPISGAGVIRTDDLTVQYVLPLPAGTTVSKRIPIWYAESNDTGYERVDRERDDPFRSTCRGTPGGGVRGVTTLTEPTSLEVLDNPDRTFTSSQSHQNKMARGLSRAISRRLFLVSLRQVHITVTLYAVLDPPPLQDS